MAISVTMPDEYVEFTKKDFAEQRDLPGGVYVLYDGDGRCLYVGQSKCPADRVRQHIAGHGNSADFCAMIDRIRIYYIANPYERDIYETHAINAFEGEFNRAKSFTIRGPSIVYASMLDDVNDEIEMLKTLLRDAKTEYEASRFHYTAPQFRKTNNFTGEPAVSHANEAAYWEEIAEEYAEGLTREKIEYETKVSEITEELKGLRNKRKTLREKLTI